MAKGTALAKTPSNEVAKKPHAEAGLPEWAEELQPQGLGISTKASDNLVPMIYVLQPNSPQVVKRNEKYVEGAEPGMIWLKNDATGVNVVAGEEGILFQPCFFKIDWVEWVPRNDGGGLVDRHPERPAQAVEKEITEDGNTITRWVMPNGNHVVETRYFFGFVHGHGPVPLPYVIPMKGTMHTPAKGWMTLMKSQRLGNAMADSFMVLYRLTTKYNKNKKGEWFNWEIAKEGWVQTKDDVEMGRALHDAVLEGEKVAGEETAGVDDTAVDPAGGV